MKFIKENIVVKKQENSQHAYEVYYDLPNGDVIGNICGVDGIERTKHIIEKSYEGMIVDLSAHDLIKFAAGELRI